MSNLKGEDMSNINQSEAEAITETIKKAHDIGYDKGLADGIKQERERVLRCFYDFTAPSCQLYGIRLANEIKHRILNPEPQPNK